VLFIRWNKSLEGEELGPVLEEGPNCISLKRGEE
jgi:hypothetical protein